MIDEKWFCRQTVSSSSRNRPWSVSEETPLLSEAADQPARLKPAKYFGLVRT